MNNPFWCCNDSFTAHDFRMKAVMTSAKALGFSNMIKCPAFFMILPKNLSPTTYFLAMDLGISMGATESESPQKNIMGMSSLDRASSQRGSNLALKVERWRSLKRCCWGDQCWPVIEISDCLVRKSVASVQLHEQENIGNVLVSLIRIRIGWTPMEKDEVLQINPKCCSYHIDLSCWAKKVFAKLYGNFGDRSLRNWPNFGIKRSLWLNLMLMSS